MIVFESTKLDFFGGWLGREKIGYRRIPSPHSRGYYSTSEHFYKIKESYIIDSKCISEHCWLLWWQCYWCNIKNVRLSDSNSRLSICESGALSTEPLPRGLLTSCCAQYLCRPDSVLYVVDSAFAFTTLLSSVERQCPHCLLLVTTFLFSRIGSYSSDASVIKEYLRLSSFELAFVLCESGALSTEPPPAGILTSCCAQYLSRPL